MDDFNTKCLDHGFVRLVDHMGGDASVVQAARVSYGGGTKTPEEDEKLIHYLKKNQHTTPFEMVVFKFHAKMPIFVARQWVRHRTASINEVSARYSELPGEFYIPETLRAQATGNKQSTEETEDAHLDGWLENIEHHGEAAYTLYKEMLADGVGREMARMVLPLNIYTEWYWKTDLHNLFNFLRLRLDSHAQYEIRVYAEAMARMVSEVAPICWAAFKEHTLEASS